MSHWFKKSKSKVEEPFKVARLRSKKTYSKRTRKRTTLTKEQSAWTEQNLIDRFRGLKNI